MPKGKVESLKMGGSAIYSIRVQGRLVPKWADPIEGMNITEDIGSDGMSETVLVGRKHHALTGTLGFICLKRERSS